MTGIQYFTIKGNRYTTYHLVVFFLTFFSYALFHAARKSFSNVKTTISDEWRDSSSSNDKSCLLKPDDIWNSHKMYNNANDAKLFLGVLDALFLGAYSIGLFVSGILGDRYDLRLVLTLGMCVSAITVFIFGTLSEWLHLYNKYWYAFLWILNGFAQSTGWPTVVAVMGNWFGENGRGLIFGIWSSTASIGNIIGALMVSSVLDFGYEYAFLFTSVALFAGGVVNFFGLIPSPKDVGVKTEDEETEHDALLSSNEKSQPIGFFKAVMLPGVIMYSLCYACLKMVNYSFFFWLPFYLSNKYSWKESVADKISIWYDVGGIFGGIIGGLVSDILKSRSVVVVTMLALAIPSIYIYSLSPPNQTINAFLMSITGFFIGGVANMISAAITADLGRQGPIQGNKEALATVTGIVDGTGSVGAALGQILVPLIQEKFNWFYVFYLFIFLCVLTAVCIFPLFIRELKTLIVQFRSRNRNTGYQTINTDEIDNSE